MANNTKKKQSDISLHTDAKEKANENKKPKRSQQGAPKKTTNQKSHRQTPKAEQKQNAQAGSAKTERVAKNKTESERQGKRMTKNERKEKAAKHISTTKSSDKQRFKDGQRKKKKNAQKLKVMLLGGLQEIGKNITVLEYGEHIVVIDCGLSFPDDDMLGVDLVIPDISYLEKNAHKIHALLLTHGHEDHIGGIPFFLRSINVPIYSTALTLGILKRKLEEYSLPQTPDLRTVVAGDTVDLGVFHAEFIHVNHSIADACAIAIRTPVGTVFHTGDFKLDVSPIDGKMMDLTRIGQIGDEGVTLMLGESTNAERAGYTPSEKNVGRSLEAIFTNNKKKRIVIATFSSNVHRVQQIIDASVRHNRKVAVIGRSMLNVTYAAQELGYLNAPEGTIIDVKEIKKYNHESLTLITTGSQGEPMSALYRMAFNEHDKVKLGADDLVVLSSSPIPGNEKLISKIINALVNNGIEVVHDSVADVHVSGHACSEELKLMLSLVRPKFFMPIHGEAKHLFAHKEIAEFMGIPPMNIFIGENGRVLEVDEDGAKWTSSVPAGRLLIDGSGIGDVGNIVLRDRKILSQDGIIIRIAAESIRVCSRPSKGVTLMKTGEGDKVVTLARAPQVVDEEEPEDENAEETSEEPAEEDS